MRPSDYTKTMPSMRIHCPDAHRCHSRWSFFWDGSLDGERRYRCQAWSTCRRSPLLTLFCTENEKWQIQLTIQTNERTNEWMIDTAAQVRLQLFGRDETRMKMKQKKRERQCDDSLPFTNSIIFGSCFAIVSILSFSPLVNVSLFLLGPHTFTRTHAHGRADTTNRRAYEWVALKPRNFHIYIYFSSQFSITFSIITFVAHPFTIETIFRLTWSEIWMLKQLIGRFSYFLLSFCRAADAVASTKNLSLLHLFGSVHARDETWFSHLFIVKIKHKITQFTTLIVHWTWYKSIEHYFQIKMISKIWNKERCALVVTVQLLRLLLSYAIFVFLVVSAHKTSCPTASRPCIVVDVKAKHNLCSSDGPYECVQWFAQTIRANGPITQQMKNSFSIFRWPSSMRCSPIEEQMRF